MRHAILALAALGGALLPTAAHADAAHDEMVRRGPYDGTASYQPPWQAVNTQGAIPLSCYQWRSGNVEVRSGAVETNAYGELMTCSLSPPGR